jgi:multidrug efflux pump subunit AcrA (membrane-fusion protein)
MRWMILGAAAFAILSWSCNRQPPQELVGASVPPEAGVVEISPEMQQRADIRAEPLPYQTVAPEVTAYGRLAEDPGLSFVIRAPAAGSIAAQQAPWPSLGQALARGAVLGAVFPRLSPAERLTLTDRLNAARAELESAEAALAASAAALDRARKLNADNQNMSDRQLQEAEARFHTEEARAAAANATVRALESGLAPGAAPVPLVADQGGEVVEILARPGESVESGQPLIRLARFDCLLAHVALPPGESAIQPPDRARVVVLGHEDRPLAGQLLSRGTAVDPSAPGQPLVYRVAAPGLHLRPGMPVAAFLPVPGQRLEGAIAPPEAIIRQDGYAWIYAASGERRFERRRVQLLRRVERGWVVSGIPPQSKVVVSGAQVLLSEELKGALPKAREGDER